MKQQISTWILKTIICLAMTTGVDAESHKLAIIIPTQSLASNDSIAALASAIKSEYDSQGLKTKIYSTTWVDNLIDQELPQFKKSIEKLKYVAFAQHENCGLVGYVGPLKQKLAVEKRAHLWGCNLIALTQGEYVTRLGTPVRSLPFRSTDRPRESELRLATGFATPADLTRFEQRYFRQLSGVTLKGLTIESLSQSSIGHDSGLQIGDRIISVDNIEPGNTRLMKHLADVPDGGRVSFRIQRRDTSQDIPIVIHQKKPDWDCVATLLGRGIDEVCKDPARNARRHEWIVSADANTKYFLLSPTWSSRNSQSVSAMPLINAIAERFHSQGLRWLLVSDDLNQRDATEFVKDNPLKALFAIDTLLTLDLHISPDKYCLLDSAGRFVYVNLELDEVAERINGLIGAQVTLQPQVKD